MKSKSIGTKGLCVGIIGLGYVGLPLAVAFGKHREVVGFDIDTQRVDELRRNVDRTGEASAEELAAAVYLKVTAAVEDLRQCNCFIVTVPTPVDKYKRPDLSALVAASATVARVLSPGGLVIYESTVYPGATEEVCVPVLEEGSGLRYISSGHNEALAEKGFFVGYSPERINPGDKQHRIHNIVKVTSGSTPDAAELVDALYKEIVVVGTYKASSIRVAEAAKVIENTQRDLNIALINELAIIFNHMGIDTEDVLLAAGTKWNFLPFRPGLVGGHCIGVDPYYLTHKAQEIGYNPEIILAGRRLNDRMGCHVANQLIKAMGKRGISAAQAKVLVLGLTFKENCPDLRNTRVVDVIHELEDYGCAVHVFDPWVDPAEAKEAYAIEMTTALEPGTYDAVIIAVAHTHFPAMGVEAIRALGKPVHVLYDLKYVFSAAQTDLRL